MGCGGRGIEVVAGSHKRQQIRQFADLARHYGLCGSVASDFHGPQGRYCELGDLPSLPRDLVPIWHYFQASPS